LRYTKESLYVYGGRISPIRSVCFSRHTDQLILAEAADYVHIVDMASGGTAMQSLDMFGEINGVALSPDDTSLFVGLTDRVYGCLAEFRLASSHQQHYRHHVVDECFFG